MIHSPRNRRLVCSSPRPLPSIRLPYQERTSSSILTYSRARFHFPHALTGYAGGNIAKLVHMQLSCYRIGNIGGVESALTARDEILRSSNNKSAPLSLRCTSICETIHRLLALLAVLYHQQRTCKKSAIPVPTHVDTISHTDATNGTGWPGARCRVFET
jgi:hypothetical protein